MLNLSKLVMLELHHVSVELIKRSHSDKIIDLREEGAVLTLIHHLSLLIYFSLLIIVLLLIDEPLVGLLMLLLRDDLFRL